MSNNFKERVSFPNVFLYLCMKFETILAQQLNRNPKGILKTQKSYSLCIIIMIEAANRKPKYKYSDTHSSLSLLNGIDGIQLKISAISR